MNGNTKNVAVVAGDRVYDTVIRPGTTAADVLHDVQLPQEYWIGRKDTPPFGQTEDIFGLVREGEKLFASPEATVGVAAGASGNLRGGSWG